MLNEALRRELLDLREEDRRVRNEEKASAGRKNGLPSKAGANCVGHVGTSAVGRPGFAGSRRAWRSWTRLALSYIGIVRRTPRPLGCNHLS